MAGNGPSSAKGSRVDKRSREASILDELVASEPWREVTSSPLERTLSEVLRSDSRVPLSQSTPSA